MMKFAIALCVVATLAFASAEEGNNPCIYRPEYGECVGHKEGDHKRWYWNSEDGKCRPFRYSGCGGNKNNFLKKSDCKKTCEKGSGIGVCHLQPSVGKINKGNPSYWFWDTFYGKCQKFFYKGKKANGNMFKTKEECIQKCSPPGYATEFSTNVDDRCHLPTDHGTCSGPRKERYFWSSKTNKCHKRNYLGCGGNNNLFHTEDECTNTCRYKGTGICHATPTRERCKPDWVKRWYFATHTFKCKEFRFYGCEKPTKNLYETYEDCMKTCSSTTGVKSKPEPKPEPSPQPTPVTNQKSCVGHCDGPSADETCYCDTACIDEEDCCTDFLTCPGAAEALKQKSCSGTCDGRSPDKSCYCDGECNKYGDCCHDYDEKACKKQQFN